MSDSQVLQFRRRLAPYESATALFRAANYGACLNALDGHDGTAAAALRARVLLRLGRTSDAIEEIDAELDGDLAHHVAAEMMALKAGGLAEIGQLGEAEALLTDARVRAFLSANPAVEADVELETARFHWTQGRLDLVRVSLERTLAAGAQLSAWMVPADDPYIRSMAETRARAYDLLGLVAAVEQDYCLQADRVLEAIHELELDKEMDPYLYASFLMNLAVLVRDLDVPELYEKLRPRVDAFTFTSGTKLHEFFIRRSLGMRHALEGDHLGGLREFRRSAEAAPSAAFRIVAVLDRVGLAREIGERVFAQEELDYALSLSRTVNWESDAVPDRFPLFLLAQELAPINPAEARALLDRYLKAKAPVPRYDIGRVDRRFRADENCALAAVVRAEGDTKRATALLLDAFDAFSAVGYNWRAALIAADLAELTGERRFLDYALREAEKRPQSWLTRRLRAGAV